MQSFVKKVAQKVAKLSNEQVKQLLDAVMEQNDTLDSVIDSLNVGLIVCNSDGNLLLANKAAERYIPFSVNPSVAIEMHGAENLIWKIIGDADVAKFLQLVYEKQKSNCSEEFTLETSGGAARIIIISAVSLVKKRKITGTIIQIDDVTDRRNQQVLLRRMESLASLTNLAANVAHEIKNPLGSISIHIQLIQKALKKAREADGKLPDEKFAEKYLDVVNEEIERLNKIVVDFLFAVRPISAKLEPVKPDGIIKDLCDFMLPELENSGVTLDLGFVSPSVNVMLDSQLFKQIIINLVKNAMAAMPDGGSLMINTSIKDDSYIIKIADNGVGMDEQTLSRIFEPYFTTKVNGTGLGLTMVYKIIKEFGGDIQARSFLGEGTLFIISLPIPQKEKRLLESNLKDNSYEV